jgi:pimeloyl-ACP methyl ester carboxylesterase
VRRLATDSGPVVQVEGRRVGITTTGDGPPVVLLHGIGRDRGDWRTIAPALAERFTVHAIDIEGFGASEPWGASISLASMARAVRSTLVAVGEHRPVRLVGNSMGGAVALRIAADDPSTVERLVLISPAGFGRDAMLGLRLLTVPVLGQALLALDASPLSLRLHALLVDREPTARALAAASAHRLRHRGMRRQYLQVVRDLGAWSGIREDWRREVLDALAAAGLPTLVLWGDRDTVLPHAHLAAVQQAVPHAETLLLPGLGHMPQLEQPERIARLLTDFLTRAA